MARQVNYTHEKEEKKKRYTIKQVNYTQDRKRKKEKKRKKKEKNYIPS